MKKTKLITNIGLVGALAFCALPLNSCQRRLKDNEVHVSTLCDIHGELPGYGDDFFKCPNENAGIIRTAQEVQKIHKDYPGSVTLLCGDQNSSGSFSTCTKGDTMYPVFKAMNIPYSAVGNHAWDFGKEKLLNKTFDRLGRTDSTVGNYFVTSNVLNDKTLQTKNWVYDETNPQFENDYNIWYTSKIAWADTYKILDMASHKVALIGLTTKQTLEDGAKSEIANLSFIDCIPAIHYTKHQMKQELGQDFFDQIDCFIALTHVPVGTNDAGEVYGEAVDAIKNLDTNIDLWLSGHWHNNVAAKVHNDKLNKDIPIMQSAAHLKSFCDAQIQFDNSKPAGKRLKDINVKIVTPDIAQDKTQAAAQIQDIIDHPVNDIVKNTCDAYKVQKQKAMDVLNVELGQSTNGLKYDILNHWDGKYGSTGVEQVGAFCSKANALGFPIVYSQEIEQGNVVKPSFSIITNDSINQAINPGKVILNDIYGFFPFDNKPVYFALTYHQLEQVVKYMLAHNTTNTEYYEEPLFYDDDDTQQVDPSVIGPIRFTYCPAQYHGFSFEVNKKQVQNSYYYEYKPRTLKIYNPSSGNDIDDVDNYEGYSFWQGKLITGIMSNFNFDDGNKQFKMIKHFATYNETQLSTDVYKIHRYDDDIRQLCIEYIKQLTSQGKTVDISIDVLNKLFNGF